MNFLKETPRQPIDLRQIGSGGLKNFGGYIHESTIRDLEGRRAVEIYKEMADNDATVGVIIYAINALLKQVKWHVTPASSAPFDQEAADFVETCMHDMSTSWQDFLSEAFSGFLRFGYSLHEVVYKRRGGQVDQPHLQSKYSDGRIGWRNLAGRSQDTIYRWVVADNGDILGAEQQAPPHYRITFLPLDKCLLFRTSAEKNNPEGRSILRTAYRAWFIKRGLENIEAVGVEKDISGLPIAWIPRELLAVAQQSAAYEDGTVNYEVAAAKAMVSEFKKMATEVRRDAHEGLVMPLEYDENGNKKFDLTLLSSGGSRQFDLDKIIQRWDQRIAMSVMADFLLLGQGAGAQGSYAMHTDKRSLFLQSIASFLQSFCETLNKGVAKLMRLNTFQVSDYPKIEFGSLEQVDLAEQGDFLTKCAQAGMSIFPDDNLEDHLRRIAAWPERTQDLGDVSDVLPQPSEGRDDVPELLDNASLGQAGVESNASTFTGTPVTNRGVGLPA